MKCPCPKCDVVLEIPEQGISTDGRSQNCPDCKSKYWFRRENFMQRGFKKLGKIYCFGCGQELGAEHFCSHCGSLCPDYSVVQSSKFVAQKKQKAGFSLSLARKPKKEKVASVSRDVPEEHSDHTAESPTNKRWLLYVGLAVLLLVLTGGMTKLYLDNKVEKEYSKKFIVALYGVKSGTDLSLGLIADITSGWEETQETTNIAPRTSKKDLDKMVKVKAKIDQTLESLSESPEKFVESKNKLLKLYSLYEKIYALNTSVPTSLDVFNAEVDKAEKNFFSAANDLKNTMPEPLVEELKEAVVKYKNLRFLVKGA